MPNRIRTAVLGLAVATLAAMPSAAAAAETADAAGSEPATGDPQWTSRFCEHRFDRATRTYRETFPARDLATLGDLLHEQVTVVLADGTVVLGRDRAIDALTPFFEDPRWTQTFDEVTRVVNRCRSGFILFDSVLSFPSGFTRHTLIGLTFTFEHGRWLILHDQVTPLPEP